MKQNIDLSKPLDLSSIGTDRDPCFGKHYDSLADECSRCGDAEFCTIAMGARLNTKRSKLESKQKFKDLEEGSHQRKEETQEKKVAKYMRVKLKATEESEMPYGRMVKKVMKKFEVDKNEAKDLIKSALIGTSKITKEGKTLTYNGN